MSPEEIKARLAALAPQVKHLGDGRSYRIDYGVDGRWRILMTVESTHMCDQATRMFLTEGYRPRGVPC